MPIEITVPRLGWSMEEGTFGGWLKQNGDHVSAGEPLFAVESDKVTMDVESLDNGILYLPPGAPEPGVIIVVGQRLGLLLAPGEPAPETIDARQPDAGSLPGLVLSTQSPTVLADTPIRSRRTPVTPRARRVAAELGVDTTLLRGSGRGGRIREVDVRAAGSGLAAAGAVPITTLRRTIARRVMESLQNTAPVTLTTRADATALVALRNQWKLVPAGPVPSYTDILAKLVATVFESHPTLFGRWESDRIVLSRKAHIGIAVDTSQGLLVPVLRDVAASSLADLARRSRRLVEAARAHRLRVEDLAGGTFSITNLGRFGIDAFTPIINFPEAAVLGVGAIRREPVVLERGELAARDQMTLSLTFDHRIADGAVAARFLQALVHLIEVLPPDVHCPEYAAS
jgi:pyruvate dehydrogenase E2 component (dihydrolipoamide acetyltransferase)